LRIIGGAYKGRKILVSRSFDSRPTTDFAREALFNILTNQRNVDEAVVLDLFTGTGSISLEFASRGCKEIDSVDINSKAIRHIAEITGDLQIKNIHPVRMDVFRFIPVCKKQYHIIFADPPYTLKNTHELPDLIFSHQLLHADGWFILEHSKSSDFASHPHLFDRRNYGSVYFSFFC
jgi:16S rRNA (guanine966-N2)-methyltransferase